MEEADKKRIQANYTEIVRDVRVQDIQDYMFEKGLFSEEDLEKINYIDRGITPQEAARRLVMIVLKGGDKAFAIFCDSLLGDARYEALRIKILNTDPELVDRNRPDEVDSDLKLNQLQEQLKMQTYMLSKCMQEIDQLNIKVEENKTAVDTRQSKYEDLEKIMNELGIHETEVKDILRSYMKSRKFDNVDSTSQNDKISSWPEEVLRRDSSRLVDSTEIVARTLGRDIAFYVANNYNVTKPPPNVYAATMRKLVKEISDKHEDDFGSYLDKMFLNQMNGYQTLVHVADVMFDHEPRWGRIVVLYAFGGWVAKYYHQQGSTELADIVGDFIGFYLAHNYGDWIKENGGWDYFNEFFGERQDENSRFFHTALLTSIASAGLITLITLVTSGRK